MKIEINFCAIPKRNKKKDIAKVIKSAYQCPFNKEKIPTPKSMGVGIEY